MNTPTRKRLSLSPEKLTLAKTAYSVESECARTYFILGDAVVWSHHPHLQILACFRTMKDVNDRKTLKNYGVHVVGELSQKTFDHFRNNLTGVLGENRRRNKAGRIWLHIPDEDGTTITATSFWAKRGSITDHDIGLLRRAFQVKSPIWVDWIDRARAKCYPA